ncbi:hypothetical protein PIGHUM_01208 [Pigmentiphaga humi]|uniref:Uncharacterized protein n=1 Tax=Pigmentiphaga humi TaxID=2478468 RepID=A0A3P4B0H0_9BURK|nr:hypothetical protein [Pigmentiphaga humi]VCU69148.1 hypothetical protein PIGHUM_01208 [Pigmentiphaga humi]
MLSKNDFRHYDISAFPIVSIRGSRLPAGYAPQWIVEMEALVANAQPFVFIFIDSAEHPEHEDQKAQVQWLKANKKTLAQVCKGIVAVEPDRARRVLKRAQALALSAAFGLRMSVAPDLGEARVRAQRLLEGNEIADDEE